MVKPEQVSSYGIIYGVATEDPNLLKVQDMVVKSEIKKAPQPVCGPGAVCDYPGSFRYLGRNPAWQRRRNPADRYAAGHGHMGHVYAYNY